MPSSPTIAKLAAPRPMDIVRRPRVAALIEQALHTGRCWLAAPGGYGKTTAVVDYLDASGRPFIWLRVDDGDEDIAQFFHYLALSLEPAQGESLPVFTQEYAERPLEFARRFLRLFLALLKPSTVLVLDDLHSVSLPLFQQVLAVLFRELPETLSCICLSRTLPDKELDDFLHYDRLRLVDQSALEFSDAEARSLVEKRGAASVDIGAARGWAVGLILLASHQQGAGSASVGDGRHDRLFDALGRHFFLSLPETDRDILLKLNILPEIRSDLANAMVGGNQGEQLLERLLRRQLLITRSGASRDLFQMHDLLRDFLDRQLAQNLPAEEQARLRERAARILRDAGDVDAAIPLALLAGSWQLAQDLMLERAETVLAQGRRSTFLEWCAHLPETSMGSWLLYWIGVAHMPDDAAAEQWLGKAWTSFQHEGDWRGAYLTVARAVLVKADSWRTHDGLSVWTSRAIASLAHGLPDLHGEEALLVRIGLMRALDFADDHAANAAWGQMLVEQLMEHLANRAATSPSLRLAASETLIEHAGIFADNDVFQQAVDSVADDLRDPAASPWALGMWLVAFGAANGRYFPYSRRGFPYKSAEDALSAAIEIGERETLRGVEFGALYHLQLLMKRRSDFGEFGRLVERLAEIGDSRFTTQVAVVADCHAALHVRQGDFAAAYQDCSRFMAAIEAANEPIVERVPHYQTKFQVLLADRRPAEAIALLETILPQLAGGSQQRTLICILAGKALAAKWSGDPSYHQELVRLVCQLRESRWFSILLNLPELLADLMGDAIGWGVEVEFCRLVIQERRLSPPSARPPHWPWQVKIHVLGEFRLELDGKVLELGPKPPTRALDILRILAVSKDQVCPLDRLQDWLWPDLDGDQAKAACEQALHRLRKVLGQPTLVVQREAALRLAADRVWVDLVDWESRARKLEPLAGRGEAALAERERLVLDFPGPLLPHAAQVRWILPVAERVRRQFLDLAAATGKAFEGRNSDAQARAVYQRALEAYPDAEPIQRSLVGVPLGGRSSAPAGRQILN